MKTSTKDTKVFRYTALVKLASRNEAEQVVKKLIDEIGEGPPYDKVSRVDNSIFLETDDEQSIIALARCFGRLDEFHSNFD